VTAVQRRADHPALEGAGEGCTLQGNVIPEGKPETTMSVTLGPSLAAGQLATVKIVGTGKTDALEMRATASTLVALRAALSGLPFPPAALDGTLALGVAPVFPKFFELAATAPVVPGGSQFTVHFTSEADTLEWFRDKVDLWVEGLPAPRLSKPQFERCRGAIEFFGPQAIPPGKHATGVGLATFQNHAAFVSSKSQGRSMIAIASPGWRCRPAVGRRAR
jgi:hypothetical protein